MTAAKAAALPQVESSFTVQPAYTLLDIGVLKASRTNPRGRVNEAAVAELAQSVAKQGVLMPILVRPLFPLDGKPVSDAYTYEIVAGHRRWMAAKLAGLTSIPAMVRTLTDTEALELQVVENLQRSDLTALEEAEGYQRLMKTAKYDVARIAERVGRSVKYVYDRIKLLSLTTDAQALLIEERITAGHAILLARLSAKDQVRAMKERALFSGENTLFDPEESRRPGRELKAVSVREFAAWIDEHVRFEPEAADPMLFPETLAKVEAAPKVVAITYSNYIPDEARNGKTIGPRSWKRADGLSKSKRCEFSTMGYVAQGAHRGEAFDVCTAKEKCRTHWAGWQRERAESAREREAAVATSPAAAKAKGPKQVDPALTQLLEKGARAAEVECERQLLEKGAAASPDAFIRAFLGMRAHELFGYAAVSGEKFKARADIEKWIAKAPLPQIQRAFAWTETEYSSNWDVAEGFGIDTKALRKGFEAQAHAAYKAQTSAAKPAKAAKGAPSKKSAAKKPAKAAKSDETADDAGDGFEGEE